MAHPILSKIKQRDNFREIFASAANKMFEDEIFTRSASLAYYSVIALAPLTLIMMTCLAFLNLNIQSRLILEVQSLMGAEAADILTTVIDSAKDRPDLASPSGWIGAFVLLFTASILFSELQTTLNAIFSFKEKTTEMGSFGEVVREFIKFKTFSIGLVVAFIFVSIVSLVLSAGLSYFFSGEGNWFLQILQIAGNLAIFAAVFTFIFSALPNERVPVLSAFKGGFITAVLFVIGKYLIGIYLSRSAFGSAYGAAGSLMVFLGWMYYSALILFIGAELSAALLLQGKKEKSTSGT